MCHHMSNNAHMTVQGSSTSYLMAQHPVM